MRNKFIFLNFNFNNNLLIYKITHNFFLFFLFYTEIQLKPHHRPYAVRIAWSKLLEKHSHGNEIEQKHDEPMVTLRRNIFFSKKDEEKIKYAYHCQNFHYSYFI